MAPQDELVSTSTEEATEKASPAASSTFLKRHARTIVASVVLAVGFGWVLRAGGLPMLPPAGMMARLSGIYFVGFVVGMLVHMIARFARYHFLLAPFARLSFTRLMTINAISLALITFLPLRIGEVARPAMLRRKGHVSAWAVTGTVGAERVLDGVLFSAMLLVGLALASPREPLPSHIGSFPIPASLVTQAAKVASLVFGVAFLVMIAFYAYRSTARRVTERIIGVVSVRLAQRVADIVGRLSDGLRFLTNVRYTLLYLAVSVFSIGAQVWSIQLLGRAVGLPDLTLPQCAVILGLVALGFGLPNAPGFFGTVQLALYAGLAAYLAPETVAREGAVFVFLFYVTYLGVIVALAALSLVVEYVAPSPEALPVDQSVRP